MTIINIMCYNNMKLIFGGYIMAKEIKCPKCGGHNIQVLGNKRKGFSVGKSIGGAILTSGIGGIGLLAGFEGKQGKYEVFCTDCGYRWKVK